MIRRTLRTLALAGILAGSILAALGATALPVRAEQPVKVVYHLNEGIDQATRAMTNIRNHLETDPTAKIVVVAHGAGIDFLLKGAKKTGGSLFSNDIEELSLRGVEFRICHFTLETRHVDASMVVPDAKIVPSGVAEIARLQAREGYAYLKP